MAGRTDPFAPMPKTGGSFIGAVISTPVALTDAATIATNAALGNVFTVTLAGNRTLGAPTNAVAGQQATWLVTQDGVGGRTLNVANAAFLWPGGVEPVLSTGAGDKDVFSGIFNGTAWLMTFAKDFS